MTPETPGEMVRRLNPEWPHECGFPHSCNYRYKIIFEDVIKCGAPMGCEYAVPGAIEAEGGKA